MKTIYAGFWRRAVAFVIDNILLLLSLLPILWPISMWQNTLAAQIEQTQTLDVAAVGMLVLLSLVANLCFLVAFWLYFSLCESSSWQATLGKRIMGIKVVTHAGKRMRFLHATGRCFAKVLSSLTLNIGFVMAGCTKRKRALHDMVVQTYVVRKEFQNTDSFTDVPSHPILLSVYSVLIVLLTVYAFFFAPQEPTEEAVPAAAVAAARLNTLAQTKTAFKSPLREDGNLYFRHADGLRAVVADGYANTLFLPAGQTQVCCEQKADSNCQVTGFPVCR